MHYGMLHRVTVVTASLSSDKFTLSFAPVPKFLKRLLSPVSLQLSRKTCLPRDTQSCAPPSSCVGVAPNPPPSSSSPLRPLPARESCSNEQRPAMSARLRVPCFIHGYRGQPETCFSDQGRAVREREKGPVRVGGCGQRHRNRFVGDGERNRRRGEREGKERK